MLQAEQQEHSRSVFFGAPVCRHIIPEAFCRLALLLTSLL